MGSKPAARSWAPGQMLLAPGQGERASGPGRRDCRCQDGRWFQDFVSLVRSDCGVGEAWAKEDMLPLEREKEVEVRDVDGV